MLRVAISLMVMMAFAGSVQAENPDRPRWIVQGECYFYAAERANQVPIQYYSLVFWANYADCMQQNGQQP